MRIIVGNGGTGMPFNITDHLFTSIFNIDYTGVPTIVSLTGTGDRTIGVSSTGKIKVMSGGTFHTQNTDTGTTNQSFTINSGSANPVQLNDNSGTLEVKNGSNMTNIHGSTITADGDVIITNIANAVYFGNPTTSGTIRIIRLTSPSNMIEYQVYNGTTWTMIQRILS